MFWSSRSTNRPPITDEEAYVKWFLLNSKKVAHVRALYKKNRQEFVAVCTRGALKVLSEYASGDALFERVGELAVAYETRMKPFVEKQGGLRKCSAELQ